MGILQSEADNIDEYVCPNCERNRGINCVNMKNLNGKDFDALRKLIKQIQVIKKNKVLYFSFLFILLSLFIYK